jgi:tRNA(Ile)-lysidine synthase
MNTIYPLFLKTIKEHRLIENHSTVIAAFSGGKDSVTLVLLLKECQKDINFRLIAAYFNHRIRTDQQAEQDWVENFCRDNRVDIISGEADIPGFKKENRLNLEHAASIRRYEFLEKTAGRYKKSCIATGHTRSDLTETFLIKLFRGSGSRGLSSIYFRKDDRIIRPMLALSHQDVRSFLSRNHLTYYKDISNKDNRFLRNRIRNQLVPEINKLDPLFEQHIFRTVGMLQDEYHYFQELSRGFLDKNLIMEKVLPLAKLKSLHPALRRFVLREFIKRLKGNLLDIDFGHVEKLMDWHEGRIDSHIPGLALKLHKGYLFPERFSPAGYRYTLSSSGIIHIEEIDRKITIKSIGKFRKPKDNFEIILDPVLVRFPILIRNPIKTDCYLKFNSSFSQKVFEMIRVSGIPSEMRNYCPLIINGDGSPIWVVGSPVSDAFRVIDRAGKEFIKISCI